MNNDIFLNPGLLNQISASLMITDRALTIVWINQQMQHEFGLWEVGACLYQLFSDQHDALAHIADELVVQHVASIELSAQSLSFQMTAQRVSAQNDMILWDVVRQYSPAEQHLLESLEHRNSHIISLGQSYRNNIFHIFNSLFFMLNEQNKDIINGVALHCYGVHRMTVNAEEYILGQDGSANYTFQTVSIQHYLDQLVDSIHRLSNYEQQKLTLRILDKDVLVSLDVERFDIAMFNLIANAYQASVPEGVIQIKLSRKNDQCIIVIEDEGVGIPKNELSKVFSPYYSYKKGQHPSTIQDSTGLGLPAAKTIIQNHGGNIFITGISDGGSRAVITLPITPPSSMHATVGIPKKNLSNKISDLYTFLSGPCQFSIF